MLTSYPLHLYPPYHPPIGGEEGVDEKNIPNRTTAISMFLYIKLAQQNTSTIDIIFKPFVKRDNSLLGNPICKTVSIFLW